MKNFIIQTIIAVIVSAFIWGIFWRHQPSQNEYEILKSDSTTMHDALLTTLFELRVQHPYIVYSQAILESGNFSSPVWKENNNCFGMRLAYQRPTTAIKANRGHAVYASWRDCVLDYAIWQSIYARNLTEEEYMAKLQAIYAEDAKYMEKLKQVKPKIK